MFLHFSNEQKNGRKSETKGMSITQVTEGMLFVALKMHLKDKEIICFSSSRFHYSNITLNFHCWNGSCLASVIELYKLTKYTLVQTIYANHSIQMHMEKISFRQMWYHNHVFSYSSSFVYRAICACTKLFKISKSQVFLLPSIRHKS